MKMIFFIRFFAKNILTFALIQLKFSEYSDDITYVVSLCNFNGSSPREVGLYRNEGNYMDFRQRYENLLQILCDAYTKMYQLLKGVEQCDRELNRLSLINRPSVEEVCGVTDCKERLIVTIDKISIAIEPIHQQLDAIQAICQEVSIHPQYRRMQNLEYVIYYAIQKIINKEDINNPDIIDRLNNYKASLELDKAISEVPDSEKQVFMLVPNAQK